MKCNAVLLVFARSCCELVGRNMRLAVLGADAAAGSAADAAAGIIDNHDHAIELAVEIVASSSQGRGFHPHHQRREDA